MDGSGPDRGLEIAFGGSGQRKPGREGSFAHKHATSHGSVPLDSAGQGAWLGLSLSAQAVELKKILCLEHPTLLHQRHPEPLHPSLYLFDTATPIVEYRRSLDTDNDKNKYRHCLLRPQRFVSAMMASDGFLVDRYCSLDQLWFHSACILAALASTRRSKLTPPRVRGCGRKEPRILHADDRNENSNMVDDGASRGWVELVECSEWLRSDLKQFQRPQMPCSCQFWASSVRPGRELFFTTSGAVRISPTPQTMLLLMHSDNPWRQKSSGILVSL
jgi:hypothetical protein